MKKILNNLIWLVILVSATVNIVIFIKGIKLGEEISFYEKEIKVLHRQNLDLAKNAVGFDSLQYAASIAASLDYTKKAEPLYLEELKYARK